MFPETLFGRLNNSNSSIKKVFNKDAPFYLYFVGAGGSFVGLGIATIIGFTTGISEFGLGGFEHPYPLVIIGSPPFSAVWYFVDNIYSHNIPELQFKHIATCFLISEAEILLYHFLYGKDHEMNRKENTLPLGASIMVFVVIPISEVIYLKLWGPLKRDSSFMLRMRDKDTALLEIKKDKLEFNIPKIKYVISTAKEEQIFHLPENRLLSTYKIKIFQLNL